jgi:hypothetical protein
MANQSAQVNEVFLRTCTFAQLRLLPLGDELGYGHESDGFYRAGLYSTTMFVPERRFRIVQPYGRHVGRESTTISEHATAAEAFAEIDRLAEQMARTGAKPETVTLLVVDASGAVVRRPGAH